MGVRSLEEAASFVDRVGIALAWGKVDVVLPSLWEGIAGFDADWAIRDEAGKPTGFTPEFDRFWRWKDELAERRLACAGRHFGSAAFLIAPRLLGAAYAVTGRTGTAEDFRDTDLEAPDLEIAEVVLENGPLTGPEIRRLLGIGDRKAVDRAVARLHRRLVLTNAGAVEQSQGWRAIRHDLLARRWKRSLHRLPNETEARQALALAVLAGAGEVSAADLAGALGWRRKQAEVVLAELACRGNARRRHDDDLTLWELEKDRG
ncbi:MAG TPA: crosslink repair DNA glycosylase YcaQ family protein [Gaiellaceae bacterium]|nr:crosslink repair DNA glycosylase YcaQ family protein [Gaiellaceae bacterium]